MIETSCYQLMPVANITQAEQILSDFRELMVLGQAIEIDASLVERIDTSVLQLLVSLKKSLSENQLQLTWTATSDDFNRAVIASGVNQYLEINS
ncbi:STAS domain-containing protein [Catenovulum adriaticum]|uniref:STAS domain-containing protein n=1 Tax=Catenovulum adriaticum TaxID=2984846 RepID=A0ABY7AMI3_9ALTE|nr:STAS domain-containing protein [Catenovulum sp. TS8]WAJ69942.1 STAS domain-containing protein [Catenovulum sp. TS8]